VVVVAFERGDVELHGFMSPPENLEATERGDGFDPRRPLQTSHEKLITCNDHFFGFLAEKAKSSQNVPILKVVMRFVGV